MAFKKKKKDIMATAPPILPEIKNERCVWYHDLNKKK